MAIKRRSRNILYEDDAAWFAALIGDECPPDFNPFRFLRFQDALTFHGAPTGERYAEDARDAWERLQVQVLAEWRRRKRRGRPPGAVFDAQATVDAPPVAEPTRPPSTRRQDR